MDMEGDLRVNLILGRPFLRSAKARIDVGRGEIRFRVGKEDMFFRFKHREEQHFMIQQDSEGQALWVHHYPSQDTNPLHRKGRRKQRCGGRSIDRLRPILQDELTNGKYDGESCAC